MSAVVIGRTQPTLDIIIVNWNSGDQLRICLESIVNTDRSGFRLTNVIVVDNASADNSSSRLPADVLPIRVIANTVNVGFGAACNQGARGSTADYLLFLNPDTRLFSASLEHPMAFMQRPSSSTVGICGVQLLDEQGHIARSCANFPTLGRFAAHAIGLNRLPRWASAGVHMGAWDHRATRHVDHVIGAFYLIRRPIFTRLDGFDERFFVYLEDLDVSFRAHCLGWESVYLADGQAFHAGGGTSRNVKSARLFFSLRSRLLYGFKHFSGARAWLLVLLTIVLEPFTRTILASVRGRFRELISTWRAYYMLYKAMPTIVRRARK